MRIKSYGRYLIISTEGHLFRPPEDKTRHLVKLTTGEESLM